MTTNKATAHNFATLVPQLSPRVWERGDRIRVYLRYPRPYQGSAGGGDLGHVDFSGDSPRFVGSATSDLLAVIKDALSKLA